MKVYNPTDKSITVMIKGDTYTVGADSAISNVPSEVADYWVSSLHNFLVISEDTVTPEVIEEVKEEVKEVVEEKEEVVEEPKKIKKTIKKVTKK